MVDYFKKIVYGETELSESAIFPLGQKDIKIPIVLAIYLIKVSNRLILVDAGCDTMHGFCLKNFLGPQKALEVAGYSPSDITDIIITHSHHDHIDGLRHFPNAEIHIQKDELKLGQRYIPKGFIIHSFQNETVVANTLKVINIGGHSVGSSVVEFVFEDKNYVICGDECYHYDNLRLKQPTASTVSPEKSKAFIMKYSDKKYQCLLSHC